MSDIAAKPIKIMIKQLFVNENNSAYLKISRGKGYFRETLLLVLNWNYFTTLSALQIIHRVFRKIVLFEKSIIDKYGKYFNFF